MTTIQPTYYSAFGNRLSLGGDTMDILKKLIAMYSLHNSKPEQEKTHKGSLPIMMYFDRSGQQNSDGDYLYMNRNGFYQVYEIKKKTAEGLEVKSPAIMSNATLPGLVTDMQTKGKFSKIPELKAELDAKEQFTESATKTYVLSAKEEAYIKQVLSKDGELMKQLGSSSKAQSALGVSIANAMVSSIMGDGRLSVEKKQDLLDYIKSLVAQLPDSKSKEQCLKNIDEAKKKASYVPKTMQQAPRDLPSFEKINE